MKIGMNRRNMKSTGDLNRIADRLAVEKVLAEKRNINEAQGKTKIPYKIEDVIFPKLLEPKEPKDPIKINPGPPGRVRRREYVRRKTTEGASLVCEECGHLAYKLFNVNVESSLENRNHNESLNEPLQVCRSCFIEQNGGHMHSGEVKRIRPKFEHTFLGKTIHRATNSWHFVRRNIVVSKVNKLLNHKCNENEFFDKYITDESCSSSEEEEETISTDSENNEPCLLPFQKGYALSPRISIDNKSSVVDPKLFDFEKKESKEEIELLLKENEFSIVVDKTRPEMENTMNVGINKVSLINLIRSKSSSEDVDDIICDIIPVDQSDPENIRKMILDCNEIEIVKMPDQIKRNSNLFAPCYIENGKEWYDFDDSQVNFKVKKFNYDDQYRKNKPSIHKGICGLVTILSKSGSKIYNSSEESKLYDLNGFCWRKKDLPSYIGINRSEKVKRNGNEVRKKNMDKYVVSSKKPKLPKRLDRIKIPLSDSSMHVKKAKEREAEVCVKCEKEIDNEFYTFDRDQTPIALLKFFKDTDDSINVCINCHNSNNARNSLQNPPERKRKSDISDIEELTQFASKIIKNNHSDSANKQIVVDKEKFPSSNSLSLSKETAPVIEIDSSDNEADSSSDHFGKIDKSQLTITPTFKRKPIPKVSVDFIRNQREKKAAPKNLNKKTKYVILQAPYSNQGKIPIPTWSNYINNSTEASSNSSKSNILINGQAYVMDREIKLNELVKDNERAVRSNESQKDILYHIPTILQRSLSNQSSSSPSQFKIVNVVPANKIGKHILSKADASGFKHGVLPISKDGTIPNIKDLVAISKVKAISLARPIQVATLGNTTQNSNIMSKSSATNLSNITIKPAVDIRLTQGNLLQAENRFRKDSFSEQNKTYAFNNTSTQNHFFKKSFSSDKVLPQATSSSDIGIKLPMIKPDGKVKPKKTMNSYMIVDNSIVSKGSIKNEVI